MPQPAPLLRLQYNENSLGMSPLARQAIIDTLDIAYCYPDEYHEQLHALLAEKYQVPPQQIAIGNGSSENIQKLVQSQILLAREQNNAIQLIQPAPTFHFAEESASYLGIKTHAIPLKAENRFAFDLAKMKATADAFDGISIFYLCNPNNPTGTVIDADELFPWIDSLDPHHFIIIDEAYFEFVQRENCLSALTLIKQGRKNLAITRTFSKLYALPSYRIGYAIADEETIARSIGLMPCLNLNLAGAVAAIASLNDPDFVARCLNSLATSRQIVQDTLNTLALDYIPSNSNFIFHEIRGDGKEYAERMKAHGILVGREFPPIYGWNRVTLGRPEEMEQFVAVLKKFREKNWI